VARSCAKGRKNGGAESTCGRPQTRALKAAPTAGQKNPHRANPCKPALWPQAPSNWPPTETIRRNTKANFSL